MVEERRHECIQQEVIMKHNTELGVLGDFKDRTEKIFNQVTGAMITNVISFIVLLGMMLYLVLKK